MKERIKLKIAYALDRFFPRRFCWAMLVSWALLDGDFPTRDDTLRCMGALDGDSGFLEYDGTCYCGKFQHGKLRECDDSEPEQEVAA